jgi:carbamoyltransferase
VLLNTSFNDRNEPIVCTPGDALRCFLSTGIDCLAIGDFWVEKEE